MIVGEAGVGKSTCYRILKTAMNKVLDDNPEAGRKYCRVEERVVNPKSVTMGELYGEIDLMSQEWTDGLLSSIMRECNNSEEKGNYWIILDGPVDALWI
jgi:dynein heavy chain